MKDATEYLGERVTVPDPVKLNPFGSAPGPHGPGVVVQVWDPKFEGAAPMLGVRLDSGEEVKLGADFVTPEGGDVVSAKIEAQIPGVAARHVRAIADRDEEPLIFRAFEGSTERRVGRGRAVLISTDREAALELAERLRDLAEVERGTRAWGDGANSSIERACDAGAERIEAALEGVTS